MFVVLAATLPALLAAALWWRESVPSMEAHEAPSLTGLTVELERDDLWPGLPIRTALYRGPRGAVLIVQALEEIPRPDLLVYWTRAGTGRDRLPGDAVLLGPLTGLEPARFELPDPQGRLMLYSLGHQELLATAALEHGDGR